MNMTIREALFILSTALVLPAVLVLTYSFLMGGLKRTEDARFLPVREDDRDWWDATKPTVGGEGS